MASRNQRKKRTNRKNNVAARSEHVRATDPAQEERRPLPRGHVRSSTETKSALRTTELVAYALTVLAIVITALALDADGDGGRDPFGAEHTLRYITYLTIGYMISRGLAKAGSWNSHRRSRTDERAHQPRATDHHEPDDHHEADHHEPDHHEPDHHESRHVESEPVTSDHEDEPGTEHHDADHESEAVAATRDDVSEEQPSNRV